MKGRPLKYGEPTRNVNINFPVGLIEILTKNAHRQGLGISEYLVRLLEYTPEDPDDIPVRDNPVCDPPDTTADIPHSLEVDAEKPRQSKGHIY